MLQSKKIPFFIVLSKIDYIEGWTESTSESNMFYKKIAKLEERLEIITADLHQYDIKPVFVRRHDEIFDQGDYVLLSSMANNSDLHIFPSVIIFLEKYIKYLKNKGMNFNPKQIINEKEMLEKTLSEFKFNALQGYRNDVILLCSKYELVIDLLVALKQEDLPIDSYKIIQAVTREDIIGLKKSNKQIIIVFDIIITQSASEYANDNNITIINSDIIYHLIEQYRAYNKSEAVWPCILEIKSIENPTTINAVVIDGELRKNTPLCNVDYVDIGIVTNIRIEKTNVAYAKKGANVIISFIPDKFKMENHDIARIYSKINRKSIDVMKKFYPSETITYLDLFKELKKIFAI